MRRAITLAAVASLILAGCRGGGGESGPRAGGTLRIPVQGRVQLDPALAESRQDVLVAGLLFTSLVTLPAGATDLAPGIASSWKVADDAQSVTFTLDADAKSSDGKAITADDVIASLTRVAAPTTTSPLATLLAPVAGFAELQSGAATTLTGLTSPDAETVVVQLSQPLGDFVVNLAHPGLGIVPGGTLKPSDAPVGTGPFRVVATANDVVRLERATDANPAPYVAAIELIEQEKDPVGAVDAGRADLALEAEGNDADLPGTTGPYLAVGYYGLNLGAAVFADERVREATVRAFDAEAIVDAAYGNEVALGSGVLPEGLVDAPSDACGPACIPDPKESKKLLKGIDPRPVVHVDFDNSALQRKVAREIVSQLDDVGIDAQLRPHKPEEYDDFLASGAAELFRFGWVADVASPRAFLSPAFVAGTPENITHVADPAVTTALDRAARGVDAKAQIDAYTEAETKVLRAWVAVPLVSFRSRYVHRGEVHDLAVNVFGGIDGSRVWLDE